jgi:2-polyprenyl-6-methoxyphenol hydroxylase-like FAD-dependent oxidoreductase
MPAIVDARIPGDLVHTPHPRVAVVGGGIGGLTLSTALHRHEVVAEKFEPAAVLGQVSAAIPLDRRLA